MVSRDTMRRVVVWISGRGRAANGMVYGSREDGGDPCSVRVTNDDCIDREKNHTKKKGSDPSSSSSSSSTAPTGLTSTEAFKLLQIDPDSSSKFAQILQFAPSMALPRDQLLAGMTPVLDANSSNNNSNSNSNTWDMGSIFIADHSVVHAGPYQAQSDSGVPRIVLFTTFTCSNKRFSTSSADTYNVSDQYLPYHFCEGKWLTTGEEQVYFRVAFNSH